MKKIFLGLLIFVMILIVGGYGYYRLVIFTPPLITEEDLQAIRLMPLPAKLELKTGSVDLSKGINVSYVAIENERLKKAVGRFIERLERFSNNHGVNENGIGLILECRTDFHSDVQQLEEDESYKLKIKNNEILLESNSPYGIFRGLETLYQLIEKSKDSLTIPFAEITDTPRFPWRGLMLDVCRHWMPKEVVLRTLDAMAAVKMNVFHWHLSEDQGFRVESKIFPRLHQIGSNGKYYTQEEIMEVIGYAADRGIRVVPEFDLPGHSKSWQMAYPELSSVDFTLKFGMTKGELFAPPLDPTREEVYEFLDRFIGEMAALFPDPYFHIGGDEVDPEYWNRNASIQTFMQENEMNDHHDLQAYFNYRMHAILQKHGKLMLGWEEILHPDLGDNIVIQSWKSQRSLFESVQRGGTGILSAGYYLDHKLHAGTYYQVDPLILPGAVDITPDSSNWKMYDLTLEIPAGDMKAQLVIFDRDLRNIYGFFAIMDARNAFKQGMINEDGTIKFKMSSPMGELAFSAEILTDSINGKLSFGLLNFSAFGSKIGGSDMPGTEMPKIEVIKPLTEEEKARIIGGEACMWSEVIGPKNVDSRVWPSAAAIAEKLWSPQLLTSNVDDMYRRLVFIAEQLSEVGLEHDSYYEDMLRALGGDDGYHALKTLVDVLEEMKYYGRMASIMEMEEVYLPDLPVDRIVDAAKPESMQARAFNQLVDGYMVDPSGSELSDNIRNHLEAWAQNHQLLKPLMEKSEKIREVERISLTLAELSQYAIDKLYGKSVQISKEKLVEKLDILEVGENGVFVAVVPGLRQLLLQ